ncbi:retrovirus-related pol polyprotein from transposon TNT 1-94 [Tanacetum coccineum]
MALLLVTSRILEPCILGNSFEVPFACLSLNLYLGILCHLAILCLYLHAHYLESLLTISINIDLLLDLLLDLLAILSLMFFEEVLVEFKRIFLTWFRSCTSCSRYRSVSKQTTRFDTENKFGGVTLTPAYQADDLDAYDSGCDEISTAKAVLMANLSSYGSYVLSEVPISNNTNNDMLNQCVQEMPYSEPSHFVEHPENEIHSDSNIIPYSQYLIESQNAAVQDTNSSVQQDTLILSVFEQLSNQVTNCNKVNNDHLIANETLSVELERYKEREKEAKNIDTEITLENKVKDLDNIVCKMGQSAQTVHMLTKPQVFYDNNLKQALGFQNPFYLKKSQQIRPMLYDGNVIAKETNVISIADSKETLMLEEESRSKMLLKQSDPMILENVVPQQELTNEQALHPITDQSASSPVKIEAPRELPKLQEKDTTIEKLKANVKRLNKTSTINNVKKDIDEIETINIELEHRVTKLIAENEHLKQSYKQLYDSIKPSRAHAKEQTESLVNQLNQKSVKITDLNAQLLEKVCHNSIKNDLRKFKRKDIVDNAAQVSNATTIAPDMYKLDLVILAPRVKNNREAHEYYIKYTIEQAAILRELIKFVLWYCGPPGCSKHMTGDRSQLANFVHKFLSTVKFVNDQVAKIMGYGDYQIGNVTISRVYYVEGGGHNLFSVDQFCDSDLEVVQIVLWYLDSGCSKHMTGDRSQLANFVHKFLSTVKFVNDQVAKIMGYGDYQIGNVTISRVYYVEGEKYKQSRIVDDYSRFTWVKFLASKDEAPDFIIKFLKMIQVRLNVTVRNIRTDNGTEFVNQTLRGYYERVGISHETSVARTPQQNGVVERRNRTLVEAARTMLIFAKAPLFLWDEAIAIASKADIGIFIRFAPKKKAYRINNRRTRKIIETIHVDFDVLTAMTSEQLGSGPGLQCMTPGTPSPGLVPNPPPSVPFVPPSRHEWDLVFQPVFDEFFSPLASVASPVPVKEAPAPVKSTSSPSSTTVDQYSPLPSTSQTTPQSQSQTFPLSAEEESHDLEVAHISNDPYFGIPIQNCYLKNPHHSYVIALIALLTLPIS